MVQITRPLDVPHVQPRNEYRPTQTQPDPTFAAVFEVSEAVRSIVDNARDQEIDNDVRRNTLNFRLQLDQLRTEVERDPDFSSMPQRWQEAARRLDEDFSESMTSPMHQRMWRENVERILSEEGRHINERTQIRTVEHSRAGLITNIGALRRTITDPNASEASRSSAMQLAESALAEAALRRVLSTDDAARSLEDLRGAAAEFAQNEGMRAQAQTEEDRIWQESGEDYETALDMVRQIENPRLRDMTEDRITTRYNREEAATAEVLEGAMENAYRLIENGQGLEDLSEDDRRAIIAAGNMEGLRDYMRVRSNPASSAAFTRNSLDLRYQIESLNRPGTSVYFASIDLFTPKTEEQSEILARYGINVPPGTSIRDAMTPEHFNALRTAQRIARGEEGTGENNTTLPIRVGRSLIQYAESIGGGRLEGISGRQEDQTRKRQFEAYLMREAEDFVTSRNREPTPAEMRMIINLALTEVDRGFFGGGSQRVYESTPDRRVSVDINSIPVWQQERIARQLAAEMIAMDQDFEGLSDEQIDRMVAARYAQEIASRNR